MALLANKTHLSEFKLSEKDAQSEASESGTSNSVTSAEDLQKLAIILGLSNPEDVYQERFRVDRRRLENMLADNLEENQTAQYFFHQIMSETGTLINWPARLKIGARSKKDPHVRVAGRPEDVRSARESIMQVLDTRSNRVTMKIDVSYTDHSHIIGKGGLTIKRVMEETGCHIHFPDSNRTSTIEKSNQVSIAGDMERVERARARVRALTPLVFCFELPVGGASHSLPDIGSPYVQQIQEQYNVQVMIRTRPKLHATLLVVKGVQWEVQATMEATTLLINYMCGPLASQTQVQMSLEISPMHHCVVVGRNGEQLKVISKGTNTQVMFPDAEDPNIPAIKKSCVTVTGGIKDVYAARQQLVGSLPLVVIFDVPDEAQRMEQENLSQLMQKYNVYINARRKPKQGIISIVIKGIERCAGDIYEARRELLGGKESKITAEIPETYQLPSISASLHNFGVFNTYSPSNNINNSPCGPINMLNYVMNDYGNIGSPMFAPNPPTPGGYPSPMSPVVAPVFANTWLIPSPQPRNQSFSYTNNLGNQNVVYSQNQTNGSWNPMNTTSPMGRVQPPAATQPCPQDNRPTQPTLNQLLNISSQASSGYQSNFTGSSASLDVHSTSGGEGSSNMASPSVSPISKTNSSPTLSNENDRSQQDYCVKKQTDLAHIISELPLSERRAVGCEKKTLATIQAKLSPVADYKALKAEAKKAMHEEIGSGYRVPTPRWAGYYFSNTSPCPLDLHKNDHSPATTPDRAWNKSAGFVRPNIVETPASSPSPPPLTKSHCASQKPSVHFQRMYELLTKYHLEKYIDTFQEHEVDIMTFPTLSEHDLKEIGVRAFGARKKMMLIIDEMKRDHKSEIMDVEYNQRPDKWTQ